MEKICFILLPMVRNKQKTTRNPIVTVVACIITIVGLALVTIGCIYFSLDTWILWGGAALLGISCVVFGALTLITGKAEFLLLHLLLPLH